MATKSTTPAQKKATASARNPATKRPPHRHKPTRSIQVTIIEPAFDTQVGVSFSVLGTCDGPVGTSITATVSRGAYSQSDTQPTNSDRVWQANFSAIPFGNNYSISAQATTGGSNVDTVTDIDVSDFSILDPAADSDITSDCAVLGSCNDLLADPTLTIEVSCTAAPDSVTADTSPDGSWVAYFDDLTPGDTNVTFSAECVENGTTADPIGSIDVETSINASTEIDAPYDGENYQSIDPPLIAAPIGAPAPVIHMASGKHKNSKKVFAYVTKNGKLVHPMVPVNDGGAASGNKRNWNIELYRLFGGKAPPGTYCFHLLALKKSGDVHKQHHHRSSGRFNVLT